MVKNNLVSMVIALATIAGGMAVGGLFLGEAPLTMGMPILKQIPVMVHTLVGWVLIGSGVLSGLRQFGVKV